MKPVVIEMKDIKLSKEVYNSRPHPFFAIFIYALLVMITIALIWSYFGQIDIVVRAQGVIRPYSQMAQVINAVSGEVEEIHFYDGMHVQQGDILYILHTFHLESEANTLDTRIEILENELTALNLYIASIEAGENLIGNLNEEFSTRFDSFYMNLQSMKHISQNQNQMLEESLEHLEESLTNIRFELSMLRVLEESMLSGTNLFESHASRSLNSRNNDILNAYRNRYLTYTSDLANLRTQNRTVRDSLEGFTLIRNSLEQNENLFTETSIYSGLYNEYIMQLNVLQDRYNLARQAYERDKTLYYAGIISNIDLQETQLIYENARINIEEHSTSFTLRVDNGIRDAETRLLESNSQIEAFRLNARTDVSNQILQLETTAHDLSQRITQAGLQQETIFLLGEELGDVAISRLGEINSTLNQVGLAERELLILRSTHEQLISQIEESTVRAQIDGKINLHTEVLEGSFLMGGVNVMSIVPVREEMITANIFINNNDIASVEEGMAVTFDIPAMPRRDFGDITGNITRISPDIATQGDLHGYFLVESLLEDRIYYDVHGNKTTLRVGLHFEARVIVDRQRILFYLLDQLNFV